MDSVQNFYKNIAKLFYAIASVDGRVRPEEIEALKESLHHEWLKKQKGKEEVVHEILQNFNEIYKERRGATECFYEFVKYMNQHEELFTIPMRNTLWEVSCIVADRVNNKNKSELILLARLGKQLGLIKSKK